MALSRTLPAAVFSLGFAAAFLGAPPTASAGEVPPAKKPTKPRIIRRRAKKRPQKPIVQPIAVRVQPSATAPWKLTLENTSKKPVRIIADARLLWFEVISPRKPSWSKPKRGPKSRPLAQLRGKLPSCRPPRPLRPRSSDERRALVLEPGERYEEEFEPATICGAGKTARAIKSGAIIYPYYGFSKRRVRNYASLKKIQHKAPYIVDSLEEIRTFSPWRFLVGTPAYVALVPEDKEAEQVAATGNQPAHRGKHIDARAARLTLEVPKLSDARSASQIRMRVSLRNRGKRAAMLHLRRDDLDFSVKTPTGRVVRCKARLGRQHTARDFYRPFRPGARKRFSIRLRERCPGRTFARPGTYTVTTRLLLRQSGGHVSLRAFTAEVRAPFSTKIRVRKGRLPYHVAPPSALPAPGSKPREE